MAQIEFKYDATAEQALAQIGAFTNLVSEKIFEINEHEDRVVKTSLRLETFLEDLSELRDKALDKRNENWQLKESLDKCIEEGEECYAYPDACTEVKLPKREAKDLVEHLISMHSLLISLADAIDVLQWAKENSELEYKLKAHMLDEATRFQMKYWQLTQDPNY